MVPGQGPMNIPVGEVAALGTAVCWTISSLAFSEAGRRIGSLSLNLVRLLFAFLFITLYCGVVRGHFLPLDATPAAWFWLFVSGLVGFVFGDLCLFRAFLLIGPRTSMLMMALGPPISAVLSWVFLGERLGFFGIAGMLVTMAGVAWVVSERSSGPEKGEKVRSSRDYGRGLLLALGGAFGQAGGLVLSKMGMKNYDPFASTQIRILAGIFGFVVILTLSRWWGEFAKGARDKKALGYAAAGALAGPFVGVSLSLLAIQRTQIGVAATIMSMTPVLIIPVVILVKKERVSLRAAVGAVVAVFGVSMLWLR